MSLAVGPNENPFKQMQGLKNASQPIQGSKAGAAGKVNNQTSNKPNQPNNATNANSNAQIGNELNGSTKAGGTTASMKTGGAPMTPPATGGGNVAESGGGGDSKAIFQAGVEKGKKLALEG